MHQSGSGLQAQISFLAHPFVALQPCCESIPAFRSFHAHCTPCAPFYLILQRIAFVASLSSLLLFPNPDSPIPKCHSSGSSSLPLPQHPSLLLHTFPPTRYCHPSHPLCALHSTRTGLYHCCCCFYKSLKGWKQKARSRTRCTLGYGFLRFFIPH